tara:strand:- start:618 stop:2507 length:1890 start_codon:yes stop_codon:yes gene_type:complete
MGVYRSDQAQLTFAAEAAQGADPEMIEGTLVGSGGTGLLTADTAAGSRTISIDGGAGADFVVGDFIVIGTNIVSESASGATLFREHEVRRIEAMSAAGGASANTFTLDRPTAFFHADNSHVKEISAVGGDATRNDHDKYITFVPGVYETVDTPDPEMSFEGRRFISTQSKRNWSVAYPGQQTLTGSVSGIILLNGWPLRFPIGSVVTTPQSVAGNTAALHADARKGDIYVRIDDASGSASSAINTAAAAGGYVCIDDGSATKSEVRKFVSSVINTTYYKLNYPLQFDHDENASVDVVDSDGGDYFNHSIIEKVDLDTVSWNVHMKESSETATKNFDRRYVGGMIGSSIIAADEGGMVTMSWDSVNFLNMVHNQQNQLTVGASALYTGASITANMPRYGLTQAIDSDDIGMPGYGGTAGGAALTANAGHGYPSTQPYYFSQGTIKFFGKEFARIRSFSLSISNGEEPRYYIGRQGNRARGPYEIREGARDYSMNATVVLPDADSTAAALTTGGTPVDQESALELFRQLLLEGDYGGTTAAAARAGFTASLRFDRGTNDYIIIDIPETLETGSLPHVAGTPGTPSNSLNRQGIFITTAPHDLGTDNPLQVTVNMIFRSMKINIRDTEPVYP